MALLTTQSITLAGVGPTYAAATGGGDTFVTSDRTFVEAKNASGAPITVTVVTPGTVIGLAITDVAVSVPATTGDRMIGPMYANYFSDPTTGLGNLTYSGVTSLTIGVFNLTTP